MVFVNGKSLIIEILSYIFIITHMSSIWEML